MNTDHLYSIGQMSKVCNVSVQALRYYDSIDLAKPAVVKDNGYRYYIEEQILTVNIIKGLKELDFSLNQIKEILLRNDINYVLNILTDKNQQLDQQIQILSAAQNNVNSLINNIQLHDSLREHYIELKEILPRKVAFTRYNSPSSPLSYIKRFNELHNIIEKNQWIITGSLMAIYHDHYKEFDYNNADIEVCVCIKGVGESTKNIRNLSAGRYLSKIHIGPYDTMNDSYKYMLDWCKENRYKMVGPAVEVYLLDFLTTKDPEAFITELQIPVEKTT